MRNHKGHPLGKSGDALLGDAVARFAGSFAEQTWLSMHFARGRSLCFATTIWSGEAVLGAPHFHSSDANSRADNLAPSHGVGWAMVEKSMPCKSIPASRSFLILCSAEACEIVTPMHA